MAFTTTSEVKKYILGRIRELDKKLQKAKRNYETCTGDAVAKESWAGNVQQFQGRIHELTSILNKL